jgi:hypothetical protein
VIRNQLLPIHRPLVTLKKQTMNKIYILFLIIGISFSIDCNSQISYVKGYYINDSNQKIDCLIRNIDWKNNPKEFEYKISEQTKKETLTIESVKEFGIDNVSKYIRFDVDIDRSSNYLNLLNNDKGPKFKNEKLFLKVLIEGEASLFKYKDNSVTRYFYQTSLLGVNQLIFKQYKTPENKIKTNNEFRRQLYNNLKCSDISMADIKSIDYSKKALLKIFKKYNNCNNLGFINFEKKVKSDLFNLNVRPGFNSSSLVINNRYLSPQSKDYGNELTFRIGLEFEFIMKFNKNKWAVIVEPTYQYFKAENKAITNLSNTNIDYKSIELPIGVRHYLFLNNNSKIFINGSFISDFVLNSKVRNLDLNTSINFGMGVGYNYNNTYSLEFRYQTSRNLAKNYVLRNSDYKTISLIFGYTLF